MLKKEVNPAVIVVVLIVVVAVLGVMAYHVIVGPSKTGTHAMKNMFTQQNNQPAPAR